MADSGQVFHDDTAISRALAAVGVDTPIAPPPTGDAGGQTPSNEYFLHFEVPRRWAGQAIDVGFGLGTVFTLLPPGTWPGRSPGPLLSSLKLDSTLNPAHLKANSTDIRPTRIQ